MFIGFPRRDFQGSTRGFVKLVGKALWVSALSSALALIGSIVGLAGGPAVSQEPSPLAACPNGSQIGRNYVSAEVEPSLAVHDTQMIGMFHQDRWSNGGGHGIGVVYSKDGTNWKQTTLGSDMCDTPTTSRLHIYERSSDPWVSFSKDGTIAYASALSFNNTNNFNAVVAGSSVDGGATWNMTAIPGSVFTQTNQSTDKNATTADPTKNDVAYTVWDTLLGPTDQPDDNPHAQAYTGPTYFSKTTDGGKSWSLAQIIIDTPNRQQTIGNIIVVDPLNDALYDFTDLITTPNTPFQGTRTTESVAFVKSTDHGATWSQPQIIAPFNSLGVHNPNNIRQSLRVGDGLEEVAIDPSSRKLYVVWESSTNYQKQLKQSLGAWDDEILLTSSSDFGATWSTPTVVHHLDSGLPTYTPTVAVNGNRVAVTYYDNRYLQPGQTNALPTDYWVSISTDGGAFVEQRITTKSFDQLSAPVARGFFLGDYEGLQRSGSGFEAMFVKTNCDEPYTGTFCGPANYTGRVPQTNNTNPTDVFVAAIS
jgi:hypothetical protein